MSGIVDVAGQTGQALRVFIANCLMGGDEFTRTGNNVIRDRVVFSFGRRSYEFRQIPEVISASMEQFKGRFVPTTQVLVENVRPNEVEAVLKEVDRICWLLSFAGMCRVVRYKYEYPDGTGLGSENSTMGTAQFFRPTFVLHDGGQIKRFVEQSYAKYRRLEKRRKLNVVIDYLVQADRTGTPTEVKLIQIFVALECLKSTYARSCGFPFVKGFFRKPPARPGSQGAKYSFEELLTLMFRDVKMRRGLKRLVKLRNDLIHSGFSQAPHAKKWALYADAVDIIREYLLRLLGYRGVYSPYAFERRGITAEIR